MPFNAFAAGVGRLERRDSPMETEEGGEDPGDEVINVCGHLSLIKMCSYFYCTCPQ